MTWEADSALCGRGYECGRDYWRRQRLIRDQAPEHDPCCIDDIRVAAVVEVHRQARRDVLEHLGLGFLGRHRRAFEAVLAGFFAFRFAISCR